MYDVHCQQKLATPHTRDRYDQTKYDIGILHKTEMDLTDKRFVDMIFLAALSCLIIACQSVNSNEQAVAQNPIIDSLNDKVNSSSAYSGFEESILYTVENEALHFLCEDLSLDAYKYLEIVKNNKPDNAILIEEVYTQENFDVDTVKKIIANESFVKIYDNQVVQSLDVVYGRLIDNGLPFPKGIFIGMDRIEFLEGVFQNGIPDSINEITIITCGEIMNGNYYRFQFENDTLNEITIDSDYEWVNKEIE